MKFQPQIIDLFLVENFLLGPLDYTLDVPFTNNKEQNKEEEDEEEAP